MEPQGIEIARLDHLGIVAGVCREIGVADYLDARDTHPHERVSEGTATAALFLNGLGLTNRRLYLVSQFFADKPVEHLLGTGITADALNDDCLGRTLDWLYEHDVTQLFARLALRAWRAFGVTAERVHADTTSFSVHGQYARPLARMLAPVTDGQVSTPPEGEGLTGEELPAVIEVTSGYSRDHREDLKHWMVALVTSGEGVPQFLQPLDGNASDRCALLEVISTLTQHLQESGETPGISVAHSALYGTEHMTTLNQAGVRWVSSVGCPKRPPRRRRWWRRRRRHGSRTPTGRASGGVTCSTCRQDESGGSWCGPPKARRGRGRPVSGRRSATWRAGRSACGIWATRRLPVSPMRTPR